MKTENQTLQQLLSERVTAFADGDRPREIIDKAVEAMFVDVIKDAFRSYGDLGKAVQEAIKAAMPATLSRPIYRSAEPHQTQAALCAPEIPRNRHAELGNEQD